MPASVCRAGAARSAAAPCARDQAAPPAAGIGHAADDAAVGSASTAASTAAASAAASVIPGDLFAQIRNAETAIRGFCQLAGAAIIPADQALAGIEQAMGMLARARGLAEEAEARRAGRLLLAGPDPRAPRVPG